MKSVLTLTCLISLIGLVRVSAEPLIEGRVRLEVFNLPGQHIATKS